MTKHALFSPSSAERALRCPGSCLLNYTMDETESDVAAEGTRAHAAAEAILTGKEPVFDSEYMDDQVTKYVNYVWSLHGQDVLVEHRVDIMPGCFGTIDALVVDTDELHVVDLKYGRRKVEAKGNKQLILYACGALQQMPRAQVTLHIFQPNLGVVSTASYTAADIWSAVEEMRPGIEKAINGSTEFHAGDHCLYCKAEPYCAKRMQYFAFDSDILLNDDELAELYPKLDPMIKWAESVKKRMVADALDGKEYPGLEIVSTPGRSYISNPQLLEQQMQQYGLSVPIYERKLASMTTLKKMTGKAWSTVSEGCISRKPNTYKLEREEF